MPQQKERKLSVKQSRKRPSPTFSGKYLTFMVDIFMNGKNVFIKYIDFHEWLVVKNIWKFQVCNICEINKENSSEVYLK